MKGWLEGMAACTLAAAVLGAGTVGCSGYPGSSGSDSAAGTGSDMTGFPKMTDLPGGSETKAAEESSSAPAHTVPISVPAPHTAEEISCLPAGTEVDTSELSPETVTACFSAEEISEAVFARMEGKSYKEDCTVPLSDLRYVRVLYVGFDGNVYTGELVVNRAIADDIVSVFRSLFAAGYEIGKMILVDEYGADDNLSMADNNTSAFNYRTVAGTDNLSRHALGMAIDINPLYNPWIYTIDGTQVIDPPAGAQYADRTVSCEHCLDHDDLCVRLFLEHGFSWGGDWTDSKDYQHFSRAS